MLLDEQCNIEIRADEEWNLHYLADLPKNEQQIGGYEGGGGGGGYEGGRG